ncbi:transmembrane protein 33 [Holotrichia oblita]|uniref:Transmembrane protein 33 n=1 Tax=Holotrichia oblita TaxID=644536 RepID=A0ACB9T6F7_HOLOL|nr:transmembrane protein 33 [Holotrichia oblita]
MPRKVFNSTRIAKKLPALSKRYLTNKVDSGNWIINVAGMMFRMGVIFPDVLGSAKDAYNHSITNNLSSSVLRFYQRMSRRVQFTSAFFRELVREDSCHYLFYSLIYLYVAPITLVLLPITLFAILHAASYSLTLLDALGQNAWWGARLLISIVEFQSRNILRLAAFTEIMLMPMTIILILMGKAGLLTPFIYYHFLVQRYSSRRNPYTRNMFHELRVLLEAAAAKPSMPGILKQLLLRVVSISCKLAPPQVAQQ